MTGSEENRSIGRIFLDAVRIYFEPVLPLSKKDVRLERIYLIQSGRRAGLLDAVGLSHEIVAYNQGALIEYVFLVAERHKRLRVGLSRPDPAVGSIKALTADLFSVMNEKFFEAISRNFAFIHQHFDKRSTSQPRLAVKGNWRTEDRDKVITIFRDRPVGYGDVFLLEESSAISYCARHGRPYLCNNIVEAVLDGRYNNPRISQPEVQRITSSKYLGSARHALNKRWREVWKSQSEDRTGEYRSTLVVPISISKSKLSSETLARFDVEDSDRLIFGYLCVDHVDAGFFDEELDVPFVEIVANVLSIYAFQRLRFTDFSSTFKKAEDRLDLGDAMGQMQSSMSDILESVRVALDRRGDEESRTVGSGSRNVLLNTDEILLKLLEDHAVNTSNEDLEVSYDPSI